MESVGIPRHFRYLVQMKEQRFVFIDDIRVIACFLVMLVHASEIFYAADAIKSREDNVLNYFLERSTNASAESLNSKMKGFRAQLRGVSDLPFFMFRLCRIFG